MLKIIHTRFASFSKITVWIGGAALLFAAVMVTIDVLARKIFGITMSGSDEISGYIFAGATTWAYSYCLFTRNNIRIDALYNLLSLRSKAFLDLLGLILLSLYIYFLFTNSWEMFVENWKFNSTAQTTLATPLWMPQAFWISGLFFFLVSLSFVTLYCLIILIRKDWQGVNRIAGVKTVEEEIQEETHA